MKTIRVCAFLSHSEPDQVSAVDLVRIIQPMKYLHNWSDNDVRFSVRQFNYSDEFVSDDWDIFYFSYFYTLEKYAEIKKMAKGQQAKIICDLDDALWLMGTDNPAHEILKHGSPHMNAIMDIVNEADYITCTNRYLRNVIAQHSFKSHNSIKLFPNFIDLTTYTYRAAFKDERQIRIAHYGSNTHGNDLLEQEFFRGMDHIMKEYPEATFQTIGCFIPKYKNRWGMRYENAFGHPDIYVWIHEKFPEFMDSIDVIVTPLSDTSFNRAKSPIKFLETASAKKPGVWQNIQPYQDVVIHGQNGFLCQTAREWYEAIKTLIVNTSLRKSMGEKAYQTVEANWTIQNHVQEYAEFFKTLVCH